MALLHNINRIYFGYNIWNYTFLLVVISLNNNKDKKRKSWTFDFYFGLIVSTLVAFVFIWDNQIIGIFESIVLWTCLSSMIMLTQIHGYLYEIKETRT